jgi:TetR/AcrR family transcriptional repressor of nem operon
MGRPKAFDESDAVRAAAALFAGRAYDGVSIDDLVAALGVHRHSLYRTFGSKRGLYLAALRWQTENRLEPALAEAAAAGGLEPLNRALLRGRDALDLVLIAAVEQAPRDPEVAAEVDRAFAAIDKAVARALGEDHATGSPVAETTAAILGLRLRAKAAGPPS